MRVIEQRSFPGENRVPNVGWSTCFSRQESGTSLLCISTRLYVDDMFFCSKSAMSRDNDGDDDDGNRFINIGASFSPDIRQ